MVSEELDRLWALKDLDEQVAALTAELGRFPEQRAALERRLASERARLEEHRLQAAADQLKRRDLERRIEALTAEERKFQGQLPLVKKNEEYQALLHEISGVKAKRSDVETEVLMVLDEEDRRQRERPAIEQALKRAEREVAERTAEIDAAEAADRERVAGLEARRAEQIAHLPLATRGRYERIRVSREGRAVVAIQKGACGGCFRGQPPQVLQDARRRDRLLACDGCGRLLLWPPDAA
jgi:predicted  nucleic acid-binding Zn-ribbon protein